jgi:hypothetical protein
MYWTAQWEWTGIKLSLMVYECRTHDFSPIVVGAIKTEMMKRRRHFSSRHPRIADLCCDRRIQTGKRELDREII